MGPMGDMHAIDGSERHEILPQPGTAYSMAGCNTGRPADLRNAACYPAEAICRCGEVIRCEQWLLGAGDGEWHHTGRMPGQPDGGEGQ